MKHRKKKPKTRNFVAKDVQHSGAGIHEDKVGKFCNRARQKQQFLRELNELE